MSDNIESEPVKIEFRKIEFDFPNYAVYITSDISDIAIAPAHLHTPYTSQEQGFIPGTTVWAEVTRIRVPVTFDLHGLSDVKREFMAASLGGLLQWCDKPHIYETSFIAEDVGKLMNAKTDFIIGIFRTKEDALRAIAEKRKEEEDYLHLKLDSLLDMEETSKKFDIV